MASRSTRYRLIAVVLGLTLFADRAAAQSTTAAREPDALPPAAPSSTPPYGYPPPQYGYPPPPYGYPPPPYGYPPPQYGYSPPPAPPVLEPPAELKYNKKEPIPPGYRVVERPRTGLAIAGGVTFGGTYVLTVLVSAGFLSGPNPPAAIFIPLVGPFIEGGSLMGSDSSGEQLGGAFCILDGIVQASGIAMFVAGLASRRKLLLREDIPETSVWVTPRVLGPQGGGLSVMGVF